MLIHDNKRTLLQIGYNIFLSFLGNKKVETEPAAAADKVVEEVKKAVK